MSSNFIFFSYFWFTCHRLLHRKAYLLWKHCQNKNVKNTFSVFAKKQGSLFLTITKPSLYMLSDVVLSVLILVLWCLMVTNNVFRVLKLWSWNDWEGHSDGPHEVLLSGSHFNKYIEGVPAWAATIPHVDVQYVTAGRLPSNQPMASYRHPSHKQTKIWCIRS